ncbi:hypothetical protein [Lactococcus allomyrinae]|uniref:Membrane-anchored protein n=1 Tax=Lactococcus allomyrinae TaxID=2419773 RepID=A0A387BD62_9LACT|nr:hypothetical protein [Lactococcus allomyrinae]AYG00428.1 hypothetical protein D7I46_04595 [Lactococcus allomyrinae]
MMQEKHISNYEWNKVPAVGLLFWIAKLISTGMGESVSDASNNILKGMFGGNQVIGALLTILWSGGLFGVFLFKQKRAKRYHPIYYWGAVALLAVFGTVIADSLTAALGVPIIYLVGITTVLMGLCFFLWYRATQNLSIHQIRNSKRETYYWITVAVSFALGTLMGDWMGDHSTFDLGLGYLTAGYVLGAIFLGVLVYRLMGHPRENGVMEILTFWIAYVLTRPIGASFSDYFCYRWDNGVLGNREMSMVFIVLFASVLVAIVVKYIREKHVALAYPTE